MLYVIPDTLLKVSLNTNKTGHHVIPDTLLKVVLSTNKTGHSVRNVIPDTFLKVSGITLRTLCPVLLVLNTNKIVRHIIHHS